MSTNSESRSVVRVKLIQQTQNMFPNPKILPYFLQRSANVAYANDEESLIGIPTIFLSTRKEKVFFPIVDAHSCSQYKERFFSQRLS